MPHLVFRSTIEAPAEAVFAWHEHPGAFARLTPPWADVVLRRHEGIRDGQRAHLRLGVGPVRVRWVAQHRDYVAGRQFRDVQVKGPFAHWEHLHRMVPAGAAACLLEDTLDFALPLGPLGRLGEGRAVAELHRQFAYRHRVTRADVEAHLHYAPRPLRIAVTGASGLIGRQLVPFLTTGGHTVVRLVRRPARHDGEAGWNHRTGLFEADRLEGIDAVVHLAGEPVAGGRWSEAKKRAILSSREQATRFLAERLARLEAPPRVLLSGSAVGLYGDRGAEALDEDAPAGDGFFAVVCRAWEAATAPAEDAGIRTVHLRTGLVLTPRGGFLRPLLLPFRVGAGGPLGQGTQYLSWIALDDVLGALYHALWTETIEGPLNVTGPAPVPMNAFAETLAEVLRRPAALRVPPALIRLALGEAGGALVLSSQRVLPGRLHATGYRFRFTTLEAALRHVLGRTLDGVACLEGPPSSPTATSA